jgi:hypothetical protein
MMLSIEINTDNAAFDESPEAAIVAILLDIGIAMMKDGIEAGPILDGNGNRCGQIGIQEQLL